jgi:hypothetical protein
VSCLLTVMALSGILFPFEMGDCQATFEGSQMITWMLSLNALYFSSNIAGCKCTCIWVHGMELSRVLCE